MKKKTVILLAVHVLTIIGVTLCFKLIPVKKEAALVAAALFLWFPVWVFSSSFKLDRFIFWGHFQFFYFFALPIFIGRILFWNSDFNEIRILNIIDAQMLHKYSQYSYFLMAVLTLVSLLVQIRQSRRS